MKTVQIALKLSGELLIQIDEAAAKNYSTRSNFIRECIVLRLRGADKIEQEQDDLLEQLKTWEQTD
jgi:metal-responsive CopG/Arc/MetJ family transcriptional regulator